MRQINRYLVITESALHGERRTPQSKTNTSYLLWNLEVPSCYGAMWLMQGLGPLLKSRVGIQPSMNRFFRIMFKHQSQSWSCTGVGYSNKTMTLNCLNSTNKFMQREKYKVLKWPSVTQLKYHWKSMGCFEGGCPCLAAIKFNWTGEPLYGRMAKNTSIHNPETHHRLQEASRGCFCKRRLN